MWQFYLKTVAETSFRFNWNSFRLVYLYETLVPKMSEAFKEREWDSVTFKQLLKRKLHKAQGCLLKAFRQILFTTYLRPILQDGWETEHFVNKKTVLGKYIFVLPVRIFHVSVELLFDIFHACTSQRQGCRRHGKTWKIGLDFFSVSRK